MEHIFEILKSPLSSVTLPIAKVKSKMVVFTFADKQYVCAIPNSFEKQ